MQKNRLSLVGGGMGGGYTTITTTRYSYLVSSMENYY